LSDCQVEFLNAYTVHLAHALRETNIKVNSAHPGWVKAELGGSNAPMELADGGETSVLLATLADDGANGSFSHLGENLSIEFDRLLNVLKLG
jgi:NAD(P)-dependent dehydrogenase (short-subunit alcohol dehydrogenase family)